MKNRTENQLNMVSACIAVANSDDYKPVWSGKEPADFGPDLTQLTLAYDAATRKAALAQSAIGGTTELKALAESTLEAAAYVVARALTNHFKKTGNIAALAKVDLPRSAIVRLSGLPLVALTTELHALGTAAVSEPGAAGRGVTADRVATLGAAILTYKDAMSQPREQIVNRSTLLKEVETDAAGLVEQVRDLDDLVMQFDGTAAGLRFIEAWRRARIIVDLGTGRSDEAAKPSATATTTTAIAAPAAASTATPA